MIIQQLDFGQPGVHQTPENRGFLKNPREIRRCLKRYIARHRYRTLAAAMTPATEPS